ncbi:MAG TPA: divergent polysaccharide deacetylase family protein [Pseudomonadales bacterium]
MRLQLFCLLAIVIALSNPAIAGPDAAYVYKRPVAETRIAIIIDDIGYNIPLGRRTVAINAPLTLAVLPFTPGAVQLAEAGHRSGKEIMLHAPMSNYQDKQLGPGALTADLNKNDFLQVLRNNIRAIPHIRGVNNHMGSELTTLPEPMQWVMEELLQQDLYFIDSFTNSDSVAYDTARNHGVVSQKRDVFLDHIQEKQAIESAFDQLIRKAQRNGYAIAIGHPYPETLEVLERRLPQLAANGIKLVPVSTLIRHQPGTRLAEKH